MLDKNDNSIPESSEKPKYVGWLIGREILKYVIYLALSIVLVFLLIILGAVCLSYYIAPATGVPPSDKKLISILAQHQQMMEYVYHEISPIDPYTTVYLNKLQDRPDFAKISAKTFKAVKTLRNAGIISVGHLESCMTFDVKEAVGWEYYAHMKSLTTCHNKDRNYDNKSLFLIETDTNEFVKSLKDPVDGTLIVRMIDHRWSITHRIYMEWN